MKQCLSLLLVVALAVALAACGGKSEEAAKPPTPTPTPAATPTPAPPATVPSPPAVETATAPAAETGEEEAGEKSMTELDPLHAKLVGTAWMLGDIHVQFLDAEKVMLKGGPLNALAPNGLTAKYSYKDGLVEVSAIGQTKTGTWDGEKLVVDGTVGKKM